MDPRAAAPGALALVEEFLRTRNQVADAPDLDAWRARHGLTGQVTAETFARAIRLREALRSLMLANNGGPVDVAAVRLVNAEIGACGLRPHVQPDGFSVGVQWGAGLASDPVGGELLAVVLAAVIAAIADGSWRRMKACAAEDCYYAFYDHTRNRSGRWCDVAGCGANARMRAYRQRWSRA
jgi:predicted RNA-binding Zn ribbon-like protein